MSAKFKYRDNVIPPAPRSGSKREPWKPEFSHTTSEGSTQPFSVSCHVRMTPPPPCPPFFFNPASWWFWDLSYCCSETLEELKTKFMSSTLTGRAQSELKRQISIWIVKFLLLIWTLVWGVGLFVFSNRNFVSSSSGIFSWRIFDELRCAL